MRTGRIFSGIILCLTLVKGLGGELFASDSRIRYEGTSAAEIARAAVEGTPLSPAERPKTPPQSLVELAAVDLSTAKEITLLSLNPNLGDNIIHLYGLLPYLHEKNPGAKIRVVTPTSSVLHENEWLKPEALSVADLHTPEFKTRFQANPSILSETLSQKINPRITPDSTVIWVDGSFSRTATELISSWYTPERPPSRMEVENIQKEVLQARFSLLETIHTKAREGVGAMDSAPNIVSVHREGSSKQAFGISAPGKDWAKAFPMPSRTKVSHNPDNVYEGSAMLKKFLLGDDAYLAWDQSHYMDEKALQKPYQEALSRSFRHPTAPYIVVNLNTRGQVKVDDLKPDYAFRVRELLEGISREHPGVNIFIAPPEAAFGETTVGMVRDVIRKQQEKGVRVATLPEDRELWKPILKGASAVLTQDSGFTHVAYLFNDRVLTMSRDIPATQDASAYLGQAKYWRKPGAPSASFTHSAGHAAEALTWLGTTLRSDCARRFGDL